MAEQLRDFAQFNRHLLELSLVLSKVNNILCETKETRTADLDI